MIGAAIDLVPILIQTVMSSTFATTVLIAFVVVGLYKERIHDEKRYHHSLGLFLTHLILVFAVPQVFAVGPTIAIVAVPLGMILGFLVFSFSVVVSSRPLP